jgi:hypothetical protein
MNKDEGGRACPELAEGMKDEKGEKGITCHSERSF